MTTIVSTDHLEELNRAIDSLKAQDPAQALEVIRGVLNADPQVPEALYLLGLCSAILGDPGRAIELMNNAHELDGECRDYVDGLATMYAKVGDLNSSLYFGKLATTLEPHPELPELTPENFKNYAEALSTAHVSSIKLDAEVAFLQRRFDKAVEACEKELRIKPDSVEVLRLLGKSLIETGDFKRAEVALHAAEQIEPGDAETLTDLSRCLTLQGKHDDALACLDRAFEQDEETTQPSARRVQALSFLDDARWNTRASAEEAFLARAHALGVEAMEGGDTPPQGKIRIGLLSDKFYGCDEALVLEHFLRNYNRNRFEVFCLQQSVTNDKTTERFKSMGDSWRPVFDLDDWALASIISGDGIQALIDTVGYGQNNRRTVLSARPAPLQVGWLNHLDGTGKDVIDLVLADEATADADRRTVLPDQDVAQLDCGLFAFPQFHIGDVTPLPALEHDTITFGAYADMARVTPEVAKAWCDILAAVPRSLLALNVQPRLNDDVQAQLSERFAHFGMSKRIAFVANAPDEGQAQNPELEFLNNTDILLDAPNHSNPGRVARALWMGLPVLTYAPERRSGLVAASVLHAAGKGEWVAKSPKEMTDIAAALTADADGLSKIRTALRDDIKDSALFRGRDFAREIETAIEMALEDKGIV